MKYYIQLSSDTNAADRLNLKESEVDVIDYENNKGYDIYAVDICDSPGNVEFEALFASRDDRDDYIAANNLDTVNYETIEGGFYITCEDGDMQREIPCTCDINVAYCVWADEQ